MTVPLSCANWVVQLFEPAEATEVARVKVQEDYLAKHVVPWLLTPAAPLAGLHSFHFMRYLDPTHLPLTGIIVDFRFLAPKVSLPSVAGSVDTELQRQKATGILADLKRKPDDLWAPSIPAAYGGPDVADPWAHFLNSVSVVGLQLLKDARHDFSARSLVIENWVHCCRQVASGRG